MNENPEHPEPLPDIGPPEHVDPPGVGDCLPDIPSIDDRDPTPSELEALVRNSSASMDADKHDVQSFLENDQTRHQFGQQFNSEALRMFQLMGSDLADDAYELHDLRVRYEMNRMDLADFGL